MSIRLVAPQGHDPRVTYDVRRAAKDSVCDDYPQSSQRVIRKGDVYVLATEYPGGESGFATSAGRPIRLRLCEGCWALWLKEAVAKLHVHQPGYPCPLCGFVQPRAFWGTGPISRDTGNA